MLELRDLCVQVNGKEILHDINLTVERGETHVLFGPNGSGKTTLLMTIMGFPKYTVTKGSISFNGKDITKLHLDERARMGIGISFQRPPIVRGVKTEDVVRAALRDRVSEAEIQSLAVQSNMTEFLHRDINHGFSGGEIKRSELMQLLAQRPELTLLDEPESGVDLENISLIGELMAELLEKNCPIRERQCMGLIITHTGHILDYINARTGYVMVDGKLSCMGDPHEILKEIKEKGYVECARCAM